MLSLLRKCIPQHFFLRIWYHKVVAYAGAFRYGFPGKKMRMIGVTGTDGKTTTSTLISHILHENHVKVGMATTQSFRILDKTWTNPTHKTTMGRWGLQKLLKDMKNAGCETVVAEVSSHGIMQGRTLGITFNRGVFTNLSREHLDYHGTMEKYGATKARLFANVKKSKGISILNGDDDYVSLMKKTAGEVITYGFDKEREFHATEIQYHAHRTTFTLHGNDQSFEVRSPLTGEGNVYNVLAAVACAYSIGIEIPKALKAIESFPGVPGRMEVITTPKGVSVIIDYAVTPKALHSLYTSAREFTEGKVIAILGACGDRDQGKRPEMGRLASTLTDLVIFTNEEPYTEDPRSIIEMLVHGAKDSGAQEKKDYIIRENRTDAISYALKNAEKGDTILLTGMGDQDSMIVGTKKIPWSDRDTVKEFM